MEEAISVFRFHGFSQRELMFMASFLGITSVLVLTNFLRARPSTMLKLFTDCAQSLNQLTNRITNARATGKRKFGHLTRATGNHGLFKPVHRICMTIAVDKVQAGIALYQRLFRNVAVLKALVSYICNTSISLRNGVDIEVYANDFRSVGGRRILCAVLDEGAFYRDEDFSSPDIETYVSPGLARVPGSMMILISSVCKRSGLLYQKYAEHYGERDIANDKSPFEAEYNIVRRDDISSFISRELLVVIRFTISIILDSRRLVMLSAKSLMHRDAGSPRHGPVFITSAARLSLGTE
jgi:hypothetical protein